MLLPQKIASKHSKTYSRDIYYINKTTGINSVLKTDNQVSEMRLQKEKKEKEVLQHYYFSFQMHPILLETAHLF